MKDIIEHVCNKQGLDFDRFLRNLLELKKLAANSKNLVYLQLFLATHYSGSEKYIGIFDLVLFNRINEIDIYFNSPLDTFNKLIKYYKKGHIIIENHESEFLIEYFMDDYVHVFKSSGFLKILKELNRSFKNLNYSPFLILGKFTSKKTKKKFSYKKLDSLFYNINEEFDPEILEKYQIEPNISIKEESIFKKIEDKTKIHCLYDIDGISFSMEIGTFNQKVRSNLNIEISTNEAKTVISKNEAIIYNNSVFKIKDRFNFRIGKFFTLMGELNLFLVSSKMGIESIKKKMM